MDGITKFGYQHGLPIQIVIAFGLEEMINEKNHQLQHNDNKIFYYYGDALYPSMYLNLKDFVNALERMFIELFY